MNRTFRNNAFRLVKARQLWPAAALLILIAGGPVRGEPILSLTLDDPQGVLTPFPEGISVTEITSIPKLRSSPVSSGVGGSVYVDMDTAEWKEGTETPKTVKLVKETAAGPKSFLRIVNEAQALGTKGTIRIVPDNIGTSLAALSRVENGKVLFDGGFDMFFRYEEDPPRKPFQCPNIIHAQGGIDLVIESDVRGGITATLWDHKKEAIFDTDLDGSANADRVEANLVNSGVIDPGVLYHMAAVFRSAPDGTVTFKIFLKTGDGAINTEDESALVCKAAFRVLSENPGKCLAEDTIRLFPHSRVPPLRVSFDLAAFRIFKPAPKVIPDLAGKG